MISVFTIENYFEYNFHLSGMSKLQVQPSCITWRKNGQPLMEDKDHKFLSNGHFLKITNAQVSDTGRYTCVASNSAGDKSRSYSLNVLAPDGSTLEIFRALTSDTGKYTCVATNPAGEEDQIFTKGSSASLKCFTDGTPAPAMSWFKNGHPLITESMRRRILSTGALQIVFVQPGDTGHYTCIAANVAGSSSSTVELVVQSEWGCMETRCTVTVWTYGG
uniref:Ig-like domain-containing protein n=1 Tax=Meleagris gallopavo TaxID=9103 RepID=A0A803YEK6_MELGA